MFTFGQIPLGKVWTPLSSQLWVKYYNNCSSWRMALALNNLQRLICHETKKPNQTKPINHTRLWDAELVSYSSSATQRICLNSLEHGLGIHDFRSTWSCLIVEVLVNRTKFLQPFGYCIVINSAFIFCTTHVLGYFGDVMAQPKLLKHKFPNLTKFQVYSYGRMKQYSTCQRNNYHYTITHGGCLPRLILLQSSRINTGN